MYSILWFGHYKSALLHDTWLLLLDNLQLIDLFLSTNLAFVVSYCNHLATVDSCISLWVSLPTIFGLYGPSMLRRECHFRVICGPSTLHLFVLPCDLVYICLHEHLRKLQVFFHFIKFFLHDQLSVLVPVLDMVNLHLFLIDLVLYLLVLVHFIVNLSLNVVALFNEWLFMNQLFTIKSLHISVHFFESILVALLLNLEQVQCMMLLSDNISNYFFFCVYFLCLP